MAMQFVILKPLLSAIPFICLQFGWDISQSQLILNGAINLLSPKLYLAILKNLSVASAFYGLLSFYHGSEKDLAWCNPWPKFLCIKGVVFATFWYFTTDILCVLYNSTYYTVQH
jgi:Organic solute transporter Ostalpha